MRSYPTSQKYPTKCTAIHSHNQPTADARAAAPPPTRNHCARVTRRAWSKYIYMSNTDCHSPSVLVQSYTSQYKNESSIRVEKVHLLTE